MKQSKNNDAARFVKNRSQAKLGYHPQGVDGEQASARHDHLNEKPFRADWVVARLREYRTENQGIHADDGAEDGREWAKTEAEEVELRRIADARDRHGNWHFGKVSSAYSAAEFWEIMTGDRDLPETPYVHGFATGAMEIWDEVKDQI